jgi:hypothetical protein
MAQYVEVPKDDKPKELSLTFSLNILRIVLFIFFCVGFILGATIF